LEKDDFCDVVVADEPTISIELLDSWDPFQRGGGSVPAEGYTYIGKLSFICFGPTSKFFASTLAIGGQSDRTVEEKSKVRGSLSVKLIRREQTRTGR
jgi:hypothetical protein